MAHGTTGGRTAGSKRKPLRLARAHEMRESDERGEGEERGADDDVLDERGDGVRGRMFPSHVDEGDGDGGGPLL